jgi:hypothetical protein
VASSHRPQQLPAGSRALTGLSLHYRLAYLQHNSHCTAPRAQCRPPAHSPPHPPPSRPPTAAAAASPFKFLSSTRAIEFLPAPEATLRPSTSSPSSTTPPEGFAASPLYATQLATALHTAYFVRLYLKQAPVCTGLQHALCSPTTPGVMQLCDHCPEGLAYFCAIIAAN